MKGMVVEGWWNCIYTNAMPSCTKDKVDDPYSISLLRAPIFECCVDFCGSNIIYKKDKMSKRDWTMFSKYNNYSRFNSQRIERGGAT